MKKRGSKKSPLALQNSYFPTDCCISFVGDSPAHAVVPTLFTAWQKNTFIPPQHSGVSIESVSYRTPSLTVRPVRALPSLPTVRNS